MATKRLCFEEVNPSNYEEVCEQLHPRSGHRIVVDDSNLYSLGGYNPDFWEVEDAEDTYYPLFKELWKFNFATMKWRKLQTSNNMPKELASHAVCRSDRYLMCFGGTGIPFGEASSNQLHILNLSTLTWECVACRGDFPEKKYGHTLTLDGSHLYVCGGTTGFMYNVDVHQLDLRSREWKELKTTCQTAPTGRYRHEVAFDGTHLYLFGGGTAIETHDFETLWRFDVQNHVWQTIKTYPDSVNGFPLGRRCHSCSQFQDDVYICGGLSRGLKGFDDLWKFSLVFHTWTQIPSRMDQPKFFHSADITPEGCLFIFGGVTEYDTKRTNKISKIWLQIPSLKESAWECICQVLNMDKIAEQTELSLLSLGIPRNYAKRLS
ncbi:hypothetical protein ScPMuIL_009658 [Solemya velum]